MTIDDLITQHWAGCDVLQGETPEAYAIRHEEQRLWEAWWFETLEEMWHA